MQVRIELRDVLESGFGIDVDAVVLFNILHCEDTVRLTTVTGRIALRIGSI